MVELDIGYVGEVTRVDPTILNVLGNDGYIPVVATIATDNSGQALNINADTAAGEVGACGPTVCLTKQSSRCMHAGLGCSLGHQRPGHQHHLAAFVCFR